jgi:hypothetical protein
LVTDQVPDDDDDGGEADTVARDHEQVQPPTVVDPSTTLRTGRPEPTPAAAGSGDGALPERGSTPSVRSKPSASPSEASTTIGSPLDALARDEVLRTRRFTIAGFGIASAGIAVIPLLPGDPIATRLMIGSIATAMIGMAYLLWRTRNAVRLDGWAVAAAWYFPALCVTSTIPYFGAFSPAPIMLVLGVYFTGMGSSAVLATAIYVTCAAAQAVVAGLVIAGQIRDTGIVRPADLSVENAIIVQVLVQIVLGATFFIARVSRRTALIAVTELEAAVRAVSQREALLDEARDELERALKSNRGRGRFSEQTIGGYRLAGVIGRGAMGEVYEAQPVDGGDPVAVKLLAQTSLGNANHVRRFLRELRAAAAIDSQNVVRVLAVGETPVPYLVMEKLDGKDLSETLRGRGKMAPAQVVDLVMQIGSGVTAAGAAGVIHRDLKPQNIFGHHGTWKILDFGVSRLADHGDTLTGGHVVGTPAYMAPEQARGGAVDHRTDLYALAAIAYRALTGHPPYAGREVANTLYRVVHGAPTRPTTVVPVHPDVDLVLALGLAKDPDRRFATAIEFADALAAAVDGALPEPIRARGRALDRSAWIT